jgi:hypothetical protein
MHFKPDLMAFLSISKALSQKSVVRKEDKRREPFSKFKEIVS